MNKKIYEGLNYTLVTGESPSGTGTVYYSSSFGDTFQPFARVTVNGREISRNNHVEVGLRQSLLSHNRFEILCPSEAFFDKDNYPLTHSRDLLGQGFTIQLLRFKETTAIFEGLITAVEYLSEDKYPHIRLVGNSGTILMDQGPRCRSFTNKTLKEIVETVTGEYQDNRLNVLVSPSMQEVLPFTVCYNETDFEFLKRLAIRHGEYMYHNGQYFIFGGGDQKRVELSEGRDFQKYSLGMNSHPQQLIRHQYDLAQDTTHTAEALETEARQIVNPFQFRAVEASQKMFSRPQTGAYFPELFYRKGQEMQQAVDKKKQNHQNTVELSASTDNPHLRLGDTMQMNAYNQEKEKHQPIESYKIIEIEHQYTHEGYSNHARAIPFEQTVAPYLDETAYPVSDSQFAKVADNNDPEGLNRIKVKFFWQQGNETSPWIPLMQGHSGSGQGGHVIPETGHTVLVNFLGNNAEAPIAMGSMYNGSQKSGYHTPGNDLKAFHTRSGVQTIFNDAEGSMKHQDAAGSFIKLDGEGKIELNAQEIILNASEQIQLYAGKSVLIEALQNILVNTPLMEQLISNYFHTQAGKTLLNSINQIKIESPETFVQGGQKLMLHSDEVATLNSKRTAEIKGETKNSLTNTSETYEPVREEIKAKCLVMFRPHDKYKDNPNFGLDWLRAGDSGQKGDNWFGNIMGKYYETDNVTVFKNTNSWNTNFKKDMKMYDKLLRSYTSLNISWKDKWTGKGKNRKKEPYLYPVPVLTLLKGNSALFNLKIEIEEKPKKLTFEFKDKTAVQYFDLNLKEIGDIRKGKYDKSNYFKITCKKESPTEQVLYIKADGEICGALKIHPNTTAYQKKINVVFVKVTTNANSIEATGKCVAGGKDFFKQNFNQALVLPSIVEEDLNCKGNFLRNEFKNKFCTYELLSDKKTKGYKITKDSGLKDYLEKKLKDQFGTKYDTYYRMYFIGEEADWNGFSYFNSKFGVYFASHNKATVAHETMHAMNLAHTFDGRSASAHFTYEAYKTNNLLDYSHHLKIERFCLFLWQWKILNSKIR